MELSTTSLQLLDTTFIWGRYLIEKIRYLFLLTIKKISSNPRLRIKFILGYALRSILTYV